MTQKEKIIEELQKQLLIEMAKSKQKLNDDLIDLLPIIIEHLILIMLYPNNIELDHWKGEIKGNSSKYSMLKHNKKYPTKNDLTDYLQEANETVNNQLEWYIGEAYRKEANLDYIFKLNEINLNLMKKLILNYINYVCENINSKTGLVDENLIYNKLNEIINIYNKEK